MYFKRRRVLSWISLSGPPDAAETGTRAACLPLLPGECGSLRLFLLSFTIQQRYFKTPLTNQSCHPGTGCLQPLCQGGCHSADGACAQRAERKDFIISWPETCMPHAATSGIPLAVPHFYCKRMIHLSALATNLDNQGNNLLEKLENKIRSREMMNEYVHYGLKPLVLYCIFSAGNFASPGTCGQGE